MTGVLIRLEDQDGYSLCSASSSFLSTFCPRSRMSLASVNDLTLEGHLMSGVSQRPRPRKRESSRSVTSGMDTPVGASLIHPCHATLRRLSDSEEWKHPLAFN